MSKTERDNWMVILFFAGFVVGVLVTVAFLLAANANLFAFALFLPAGMITLGAEQVVKMVKGMPND